MTSQPVFAAPGFPAAPRRNRWYNNWKILVPVVLAAIVLLLGLFVFGVLSFVYSMLRNSESYTVAVQGANQSAQVAAEIGVPVRVGWLMSGNVNYSNSDGDANLSIPISGAKGRGHILVAGKKRAGRWTYETLEVIVDGRSAPIELPNPAPAPATPPATPPTQSAPDSSPGPA